jgi:hypothetical protein
MTVTNTPAYYDSIYTMDIDIASGKFYKQFEDLWQIQNKLACKHKNMH